MRKFDELLNSTLLENNIVKNSEEVVNTTARDTAKDIVDRMIADPRKLLPPVDVNKYITDDPSKNGAVSFTWRYGADINLTFYVTADSVDIYDTKEDKIVYSSSAIVSPVHDIASAVINKIGEIIDQDKEEGDLGITQPMDIGTNTSSKLPNAKKPTKQETIDKYLKGSTLKNR